MGNHAGNMQMCAANMQMCAANMQMCATNMQVHADNMQICIFGPLFSQGAARYLTA